MMVLKLSRAMEEAYIWDADAALKWASGLRHWPSRRFRVEGSRAGNSKLVCERDAIGMRIQYGGEVVELVPSARALARKSVYEVAAEDLGECPRCKAPDGKPCTWPTGGAPRYPHAKREDPSNLYTRAAEGLGDCSWCKAKAGEACTWPRGLQRRPHERRKKS